MALARDNAVETNEPEPLKIDETVNQIIATFPDGSQVLCWLFWVDGVIQVSKREQVGATWGPPAKGRLIKS